MVGAFTLTFERLRDNWAQLMWEAGDERRELVSHQLALHKKAMEEGTKSPYFDWFTALVVELVYTTDLKSVALMGLRVQLSLKALALAKSEVRSTLTQRAQQEPPNCNYNHAFK